MLRCMLTLNPPNTSLKGQQELLLPLRTTGKKGPSDFLSVLVVAAIVNVAARHGEQ